MISRNDPCWCGSGAKWKKCHYPSENPDDLGEKIAKEYFQRWHIRLKTKEQIEGIRKASQFTKFVLDETLKKAQAGVSTRELDQFAHELMKKHGAISPCFGYGQPPYPAQICVSLNEVICHGIPDETRLKEGDIANIDVSCVLNGYYGDCSAMVCIGEISEEKKRVVEVSLECLNRSIAILKPGVLLSEIANVIEAYAHQHHCAVVKDFVGHGIGLAFHEPPEVPHAKNNLHIPLVPGMTFTIEPMINAGKREGVLDPKDRWTVRTLDGKPSAQWEHTVLITPSGHEILTL